MPARFSSVFTTPLLISQYDQAAAVQPALLQWVDEWRAQDAGLRRSNVAGGWHSPNTALSSTLPALCSLRAWIFSQFVQGFKELAPQADVQRVQIAATGWLNVLPPGAFHVSHVHPDHAFSGCYYIQCPQEVEAGQGRLVLQDPRPAAVMINVPGSPWPARHYIPVQSGQLVIFPSWLAHYVEPHQGAADRISLAFNLRLTLKP